MNIFSKLFHKDNSEAKRGNPILYIKKAILEKDADALEDALLIKTEIKTEAEYLDLLIILLSEKWHFQHEDIARELQKIRNPKSIEVLHKTIFEKFEYLDYNNSEALARKCVWALADIGNGESKKILIEVSKTENAEISSYAKKRLDKWEDEQHRKANN